MLKTNSKKAVENIRAYIMENFEPSNYTENPPETFPEICRFILNTYESEKYYSREYAIQKKRHWHPMPHRKTSTLWGNGSAATA